MGKHSTRGVRAWVVGVSLAAAACAVNPTPRCSVPTDCARADTCYRGFCIAPTPPDGGAPCASGRTECGGCVDLDSDPGLGPELRAHVRGLLGMVRARRTT